MKGASDGVVRTVEAVSEKSSPQNLEASWVSWEVGLSGPSSVVGVAGVSSTSGGVVTSMKDPNS